MTLDNLPEIATKGAVTILVLDSAGRLIRKTSIPKRTRRRKKKVVKKKRRKKRR